MSYNQGYTSAQKKSVKLLERYRCKVCEKWKEPASFSNNELQKYTSKAVIGTVLNGVTAGLRCRGCTGGAITEKQCEGPCKKWKDLQKFSKSSRSAGGNQYCMECTLWKESQEPGVVVDRPPGDEDSDSFSFGAYSDPELGNESDDSFEEYAHSSSVAVPSQPTMVPAPAPGTRQPITSALGPREHISVPYDGLAAMSLSGNMTSETGQTMDTAKLSAPTMSGPGSRIPQVPFDARSEATSVSNPYESSSTTQARPAPVWGAMDARRRIPVTYNAWDNKGQVHTQQKISSGSGSVYTPTPSTSAVSAARPVGSRQPPAATAPRPAVGSRQPPQATASGPSRPAPQSQGRAGDDTDSEDDLYGM